MTLDELLTGHAPPGATIHSLCNRLERTHLEQELKEPLAPGHAYLSVGWEKHPGTLNGQYQYVLACAPNAEITGGLSGLGACYDATRNAWLLPLVARPALKQFMAEQRDELADLAEAAALGVARRLHKPDDTFALATKLDKAELRARRLAEAQRRTKGLLRLADFLRRHGRAGKVQHIACADGRRTLHFARHEMLGMKDQVLAYDAIEKRVWWCAGTSLDSYAAWLPVKGAQFVLDFLEQYHINPGVRIGVPADEELAAWLAGRE